MPETAVAPARLAYSIKEVLELTGVARSTLYGLISSGALPARKLGRRTLILAGDVSRLLQSLPDARDVTRSANGSPLPPANGAPLQHAAGE